MDKFLNDEIILVKKEIVVEKERLGGFYTYHLSVLENSLKVTEALKGKFERRSKDEAVDKGRD